MIRLLSQMAYAGSTSQPVPQEIIDGSPISTWIIYLLAGLVFFIVLYFLTRK